MRPGLADRARDAASVTILRRLRRRSRTGRRSCHRARSSDERDRLTSPATATIEAEEPTPMQRTPAHDRPDPILVCHSHLRWDWVYQRPQHLLSRLARHWPVIVEEEPVFDDRPPGPGRAAGGRGRDGPPAAPAGPTRTSTSAALVEDYVAAWSGATGRWSAGSTRRCSPPTAIGSGADQVVVYDCMDELANFAGAPAGLIEAEARLLERADVVFTGGRSLYESKRDRQPERPLLPLGRRARALRPGPRPRPAAARPTWPACPGRSSAITARSTSGSITT